MSDTSIQVREEPVTMLALIERLATSPDLDPAKLHSVLDFQERLMNKRAEQAFYRDFALALRDMPHVTKDRSINLGSGKGSIPYASYENLDNAVRTVENRYGFSRSFLRDGTNMTLLLAHVDGHCIRSTRPIQADKGPGRNDVQAEGSGASYAKRYLTKDIWNIITDGEDDDGQFAGAISATQAGQIERLIIDLNIDRAEFANYLEKECGVRDVALMPARAFREIESKLQQRKARVKK